MNELINVNADATDFSMLYSSVIDSGPNLARAKINKDSTTEYNGDTVEGIPAPSISLNHPEYGEVFSKDTYFRIFAETMQTSVYDADQQKFANISEHFQDFQKVANDWMGGDKCGWVSNAEREKLHVEDPVAFANASKAKLSRNLFGLIRMDNPIAASGATVEIKDVPFRIKLGPSSFFEISQVIKSMRKQSCEPLNFDIKIGFELKKAGSNKYFVLKYTPLLSERHALTDVTRPYISDFVDLIHKENMDVKSKMKDNMVPPNITQKVKTDMDQILEGNVIDDEIPF